MMERKTLIGLGIVYLISCVFCLIFYLPSLDSVYYWDWGRHVAASYFDGPPMVAYIAWIFRHVAGTHVFSINLLALLMNFLIAIPLYLLAKQLFNTRVATFSVFIWLFTLFNFQVYAINYTYDAPVTLFWITTLALFYFFVEKNKPLLLYVSAISAGLMLLSKYTGILLFLSLFILCLMQKNYRPLLKNKHLYFAALLALLIFSPVIIWNDQHSAISFSMQWRHGFSHPLQWRQFNHYFLDLLSCYNVFFMAFLFIIWKLRGSLHHDKRLAILFYPAIITLIFFAIATPFAEKTNWMETYYLSASILIAYYFCQTPIRTRVIFILLGLASLAIFIVSLTWALNNTKGTQRRHEEQLAFMQAGEAFTKPYPILVDDYNIGAGIAFYARQHPMVYAVSHKGNEYQFWHAPKNKNFYFVSYHDTQNQLRCQRIKSSELAVFLCNHKH